MLLDVVAATVTVRMDGQPLVHTSARATNLAGCLDHSVLPCSWSRWPRKLNASHVVIPLLNDTDFPLRAKVCKDCLSHFHLAVLQPKGNTGYGGPMRDGSKEQSDRLRERETLATALRECTHIGQRRKRKNTTTQHLTASSDEMVAGNLRFERAAGKICCSPMGVKHELWNRWRRSQCHRSTRQGGSACASGPHP